MGFGLGGAPMDNALFLPFARLSNEQIDLMALPEEVREALEARKDQIHSADDVRRIADDLMRRS